MDRFLAMEDCDKLFRTSEVYYILIFLPRLLVEDALHLHLYQLFLIFNGPYAVYCFFS